MRSDQIAVMEACLKSALANELSFPEIVGRLTEIGVERYHTDYCRHETTYYLADGDSHVVAADHACEPIAELFDQDAIKGAIRQSQLGEHTYRDFLCKTMAAGCVGYFVQIAGRRAIYFGRQGDFHVEHFPAAAAPISK